MTYFTFFDCDNKVCVMWIVLFYIFETGLDPVFVMKMFSYVNLRKFLIQFVKCVSKNLDNNLSSFSNVDVFLCKYEKILRTPILTDLDPDRILS